jgi:hypothetical protein
MVSLIAKQLTKILDLWRSFWERPYKTIMAVDLPERLAPKVLYIIGENGHLWFAAMICPCGCGQTLHMRLVSDARPRWTMDLDENGYPSLFPSVWRQIGCRSHFFLTHGRIRWCRSDPESSRSQ